MSDEKIIALADRIRRRIRLDHIPEGVDVQILANLKKDDFVFIRVNCEDRPSTVKQTYLRNLYESIKPVVASEVDRVIIMEDNVSMQKIEKGVPYIIRVDLADIIPKHRSEYYSQIKDVAEQLNAKGYDVIVVPANVEVEDVEVEDRK